MPKKIVISTLKAPSAIGPYSQALQFGNLLFISGQVPVDPVSGRLIEGSISDQTRQALENLKAILEAADATLDNVAKTTVFLTNLDHFKRMNSVYSEYFSYQQPARACIEVSKLPLDALVEVEAIAVLD